MIVRSEIPGAATTLAYFVVDRVLLMLNRKQHDQKFRAVHLSASRPADGHLAASNRLANELGQANEVIVDQRVRTTSSRLISSERGSRPSAYRPSSAAELFRCAGT
jgi:hypothetical protein